MDRFDKFTKIKVLVVGDVMLDKYLWGEVSRISPEAPVPVVQLQKISYIPGGAANVAANIAGLGAEAFLIGLTGNDSEGELFPSILKKSNVSGDYLVKIQDRQTTIKTRVIAHNQQIVRIDQETKESLDRVSEELIWKQIEKLLEVVKVIVISDYNKGFLNDKLVMRLITTGKKNGKIILADPKGRDYSKYRGATMITPNKFEVAEICSLNDFSEAALDDAGKSLLKTLNLESLLITRGEEGMILYEPDKKPLYLEARARHVYDVTGAGDTVIAVLAVSLGAKESFSKAAEIANMAAGLVVREVGTTTVKLEQLKDAIQV